MDLVRGARRFPLVLWSGSGWEAVSVYPAGKPISTSTHVGFSGPIVDSPITSDNGREFVATFAGDFDFQSRAIGVGNISFTAVDSPSPECFDAPLRLWFPYTVGVGHTLGVWAGCDASASRCTSDTRSDGERGDSIDPAPRAPFALCAIGVGHSFRTCADSGVPPCAYGVRRVPLSLAHGVAHTFTALARFTVVWLCPRFASKNSGRFGPPMLAVGVGHSRPFTAPSNVGLPRGNVLDPRLASAFNGVGHSRTAPDNFMSPLP